jgi:hypothetical protein
MPRVFTSILRHTLNTLALYTCHRSTLLPTPLPRLNCVPPSLCCPANFLSRFVLPIFFFLSDTIRRSKPVPLASSVFLLSYACLPFELAALACFLCHLYLYCVCCQHNMKTKSRVGLWDTNYCIDKGHRDKQTHSVKHCCRHICHNHQPILTIPSCCNI